MDQQFDFNPDLDFFSYNIPNFEKCLLEFKGKPCYALEIGSMEGRCGVWLLQNILTNPTSLLVCVDSDDCKTKQKLYSNLYVADPRSYKYKVYIGKSNIILPPLIPFYKNQFDFIYVDGCHTGYTPLFDMVCSHELLKPGGVMSIDDYGAMNSEKYDKFDVKNCFDAFYNVYYEYYNVLIKDYQVWIKKI